MFIRKKKGQSILEYTILLGVVVAGLMVMQSFVKRGYQGSLKSAADKMGEGFSAGNTTIMEDASMKGNQTIISDVATDERIQSFAKDAENVRSEGVYSLNTRQGGEMVSESKQATDSAIKEATRVKEYSDSTVSNFSAPF